VDPPATIGGGAQTGGDAMGGDGGVLSSDPLSAQSSRSLSAAHVTPCDLFFSRACGAVGPRWTARIKTLHHASLYEVGRLACGAGMTSGLAVKPAPLACIEGERERVKGVGSTRINTNYHLL
jgi:hypothetical protein